MTRVRARGEDVRRFILEKLEQHPAEISRIAGEHFKITRQAVNKHLQRLVSERCIVEEGKTKSRRYKLAALAEWHKLVDLVPGLEEDIVWRNIIRDVLGEMPDNVLNIWNYGFTEIMNNAIDHSEGSHVHIWIRKTAVTTEIVLRDTGIGIFKKIQMALNLIDERHAVLELAKGKLTTDPARHSGEGIFFSSRMFDQFNILSGGVYFAHSFGDELDWIDEREKDSSGTFVWMKLNNHTSRTKKKIFDSFSSNDDEYGFVKTIVPVRLARYGNENLISRSQAKRLLARVELFKIVVFDFKDVPTIGQAFADEIFRVFPATHPDIELVPLHASSEVKRMIERAKSGASANT